MTVREQMDTRAQEEQRGENTGGNNGMEKYRGRFRGKGNWGQGKEVQGQKH